MMSICNSPAKLEPADSAKPSIFTTQQHYNEAANIHVQEHHAALAPPMTVTHASVKKFNLSSHLKELNRSREPVSEQKANTTAANN